MGGEKRRTKAVIVGGSIGGVSCALALVRAGWEVVVVEKSAAPPKGSPTGAGVALDPLSVRIINSFVGRSDLLEQVSVPLTIDQNQAIDGENGVISRILTRDENFNFTAVHWADLHGVLYGALPPEIFMWGHLYLSLEVSADKSSVTVKAEALSNGDVVEITADLLIAADGSLSAIRQTFLPDMKLRYSGYCSWRGVLEFSGNENSETFVAAKRAYPDLGKCLYFDLARGNHSVFCEINRNKLTWVWYVHQPEPETKGTSVTMKATTEMIEHMYKEAEKIWLPEFVSVMRETKEPFINVIYDCDPPEQIFWDNVVLMGDAAHPTTPHGVRSTNMSILDAAVLGKCLEKWGADHLASALEEYQSIRLPVTSAEVLHSRRIGRIKQGMSLPDREPFDPETASSEECKELQHKHMPFYAAVPSILG